MILGIDTSCYTTSVAICDDQGRLLSDKRRLLPVERGACGLRQSEALFCHLKQLPDLVEESFASICGETLRAVAVSATPRTEAGSYMPVFLAGAAVAKSIAASHSVACFATSHQEGHLEAALLSLRLSWQEPFLALHLSGGTGEILLATPEKSGFAIKRLGDCDLPPGQFVDRVGVALGLPFPAGPHLEALAAQAEGEKLRFSGSVRGMHISFSGPESAAQRAIRAGAEPAQVAAAVLDNIAKSLGKAIRNARRESGCGKVLLMGGVVANQRIRERLKPLDLSFAEAAFTGDNASGVAHLGWKKWIESAK